MNKLEDEIWSFHAISCTLSSLSYRSGYTGAKKSTREALVDEKLLTEGFFFFSIFRFFDDGFQYANNQTHIVEWIFWSTSLGKGKREPRTVQKVTLPTFDWHHRDGTRRHQRNKFDCQQSRLTPFLLHQNLKCTAIQGLMQRNWWDLLSQYRECFRTTEYFFAFWPAGVESDEAFCECSV